MNDLQIRKIELRRAGEDVLQEMLFHTSQRMVFTEAELKSAAFSTVYGSDPSARLPFLRSACRVLTACIRGDRGKEWMADLKTLEGVVNQSFHLQAEYSSESDHCFFRQYGAGGSRFVRLLERYTILLAADHRLDPSAPIGICGHCEGIYYRRRKSQEYCSGKCRVARFAAKKGKAYFATAQRRRRAAKRTVGKIVGKLSGKRRETKGRKGKK